jgi:hypothetical protein
MIMAELAFIRLLGLLQILEIAEYSQLVAVLNTQLTALIFVQPPGHLAEWTRTVAGGWDRTHNFTAPILVL